MKPLCVTRCICRVGKGQGARHCCIDLQQPVLESGERHTGYRRRFFLDEAWMCVLFFCDEQTRKMDTELCGGVSEICVFQHTLHSIPSDGMDLSILPIPSNLQIGQWSTTLVLHGDDDAPHLHITVTSTRAKIVTGPSRRSCHYGEVKRVLSFVQVVGINHIHQSEGWIYPTSNKNLDGF